MPAHPGEAVSAPARLPAQRARLLSTLLESIKKEGEGYRVALYQRATREIQNSLSLYGGPLPARRFPGVRGGAAYIFWVIWFLLTSKGWDCRKCNFLAHSLGLT